MSARTRQPAVHPRHLRSPPAPGRMAPRRRARARAHLVHWVHEQVNRLHHARRVHEIEHVLRGANHHGVERVTDDVIREADKVVQFAVLSAPRRQHRVAARTQQVSPPHGAAARPAALHRCAACGAARAAANTHENFEGELSTVSPAAVRLRSPELSPKPPSSPPKPPPTLLANSVSVSFDSV